VSLLTQYGRWQCSPEGSTYFRDMVWIVDARYMDGASTGSIVHDLTAVNSALSLGSVDTETMLLASKSILCYIMDSVRSGTKVLGDVCFTDVGTIDDASKRHNLLSNLIEAP